jgi:hypothetical protein
MSALGKLAWPAKRAPVSPVSGSPAMEPAAMFWGTAAGVGAEALVVAAGALLRALLTMWMVFMLLIL